MKTLTLVICFIGSAALLAGIMGPAEDGNVDHKVKAPTMNVDSQPIQECTMPADADEAAPKATCFMCSSSSTGSCSGAQQCRGSRSGCRKKGCKITGTSSCSSSANVKKC